MYNTVTNHKSGHDAEKVAAKYLVNEGYKILSINWCTSVCEIDLVVQKKNVVHFVEVKFRSTNHQGGGLDYITAKKLAQMRFAAECWVQENVYTGVYELGAIELGAEYEILACIMHID